MGGYFWGEYSKYLKSLEWKEFRSLYFSVFPKRCIICGGGNVILHHLQYENYKSKRLSDYMPLCTSHHDKLTLEYRRIGRSQNLRIFSHAFVAREKLKRRKK